MKQTLRLKRAIALLKRWDEVEIPDHLWTKHWEDYTLPLDTQAFLNEINKKEVI